MTIAFVAHNTYINGSSPVTGGAYTPGTAGNQLLMFTANDASIANTVTGTQGIYSLITPPGRVNDANGDGMAIFSNPTAVATSQTHTLTATGSATNTLYGILLEYSGVGSLSNGATTQNTGIASGSNIVGAAVTVPVGSTLVAVCWSGTSATDLISCSNGTARYQIHDGVGGFSVADYTGAGASVTPTFTSTENPSSSLVVQIMLNAPGSTFALTGQSTTSSEGTISRSVTYGLTGQTATFTEGTITASTGGNVTLGLTAQTATFTEGALSLNLTYSLNDGTPLTGQTATFAEGTPLGSVTYGLTAQTATFSEGVLARNLAYGVTGQTGTLTEGTITPNTGSNVSKGLTGQTATFAEGALTPSWSGSAGLTAQTATFTEGQINAGAGYAATGQSATFTEGTLGHALGYAVAGLSVAFAEGIISRNQTGPVTIGLTAMQATFALGIITAQSTGSTIRVQAIYDGTYGGQFYEAGDVFDITSTAFSNNAVNYGPNSGTIQLGWMIQVTPSTPLYQARTSGQSSIGTWLPPNDGGRRTVY